MSGAVPAWKLALLERKKKQEEVEKSKKVQDEEAKLASLPAWKRAIILREKQAKGGVGPPSSAPPPSPAAKSPGKPSNKWQVAVERVKGPDSPILNQKSRSLTSPSPSFPKQSTKSQVVSRWKPQKEVSSAKVENNSAAVKPTPISTSSFTENEDDVSLAGMPAWKKALILKKRKVQQPSNVSNTEKTSSKPGGWDEPDAAITINESAKVEPVSKKSNQSSLAVRPEVVNRANREDSEVSSQRLVEQEGKTLHPPVYKEVDEWADVKEEDNKFKDLPLWKQALIKRRRADIAKRTGLPVSISTTLPPSTSNSISRPTSTRQTAPATRTSKEDSTPQPKKKKLTSKQPNKSSVESKKATKKIFPAISSSEKNKNAGASRRSKHHTGVSPSTKAKENENTKPVRKAPAPPSVEKEEMFTYNFSKSSHHTLDTGGSSDSTDSDFEEAIITNLDDSDEGDSGIVLQHYSTTTSSSPNLGKKSLSESILPVLSTPGKKTRRHMRRVSWSETQFVSEHSYPKYDYSDYDTIEQEETNEDPPTTSNKNLGLSHRVHPSLRPNDPYSYNFSGSPRSQPSDGSLSTFMPKGLSSYTPHYTAVDHSPMENGDSQVSQEPLDQPEQHTDTFYADLTSNTAALLW